MTFSLLCDCKGGLVIGYKVGNSDEKELVLLKFQDAITHREIVIESAEPFQRVIIVKGFIRSKYLHWYYFPCKLLFLEFFFQETSGSESFVSFCGGILTMMWILRIEKAERCKCLQ